MPQPRFAPLLIICFSLLVILPAYGQPPEPDTGDCFLDASIAEPLTLMPPLVKDAPSQKVVRLIYSGLVKYDADLRLVPDLAECWDISTDNCTITFYLRKGVKWHDGKGKEFTARDVEFTLKVMQDYKTPTANRSKFQCVGSEVLDNHIIRITYPKPFAPALDSWTMAILPKHKLEGQNLSQSPLAKKPIGTGPYKFKEWIPGERIVLTYNPDYYLVEQGRRGFLDRYEFLIKAKATMFSDLKAEKIDRMVLTPHQYLHQTGYPRFASMYDKYCYLPFSYSCLAYNLGNELFKNEEGKPNVRQALTLAIDKQKIIDGVLLGFGKVAYGPYKPGTWYYHKELPDKFKFDYNRQKARKKLEDAGWKPNSQGILEKNNRLFQFTILTNYENKIHLRIAEIIKRQLREVGIEVRIETMEWAAFKTAFEQGAFDAILMKWKTAPDPDDHYDIWHSGGSHNHIDYGNPEVDRELEKGRHTLNQEQRRKAYLRVQERLAEDQPYTFLFIPYDLSAIHQRFQGVKLAPAGLDYNFEQWYVPKDKQLLRKRRLEEKPRGGSEG